jgi:CheY-like chemotaxis protein
MRTKILWVDNDLASMAPFVKALQEEGYEVTSVPTALEAEVAIANEEFGLVILDAMIPSKGQRDEKDYDPAETDSGHKTGLIFYRRNKEQLRNSRTRTLVLTIRLDENVSEEFFQEGLPAACFATKLALRETPVFTRKVASLLSEQT